MKKLLSILLFSASSLLAAPHSLHVSPTGDDTAQGSKEAPFASLERARDELRKLKSLSKESTSGFVVWIHGGVHERTQPFLLSTEDSGVEGTPISYRSLAGQSATLSSDKRIPFEAWKPLSPQANKRVHPHINSNSLYELDYDAFKIQNGEQLAKAKDSAGAPESFILFANGKRQGLSQWPNLDEKITESNDPGWTTPNGTRDNLSFHFGSGGQPSNEDELNELDSDGTQRSARWQARLNSGHELWLRGHWRTPWAPRLSLVTAINTEEKWIQLASVPPGGMGSKYTQTFTAHDGKEYRTGSGEERYYALNMLEEIDQPGEYAIDFKDRRVYYYPPADLKTLEVTIADLATPLIEAQDADFIQFDQLTFRGGLGSGLVFKNCHHLTIRGCLIDGIGKDGIVIDGGTHHVIQSNDLREIGHSGLTINNVGNRKTLLPGRSLITNNHITKTGRLHLDSSGMRTNNVIGITISHNLIHHTPSRAYEHRNDNDIIFEYNEIHNCALKTSDTGATYGYGRWSTYGNIFRYNFIHHNRRANGFYCDDGDSGDFHYYNIIHQCIDALKFGGGHDNIAENNLLIQNTQQRIDDRGISRNYRLGTKYEKDLRGFKPFEEPWLSYGLRLKKEHQLSTQLWSDVLDPEWLPEHPNGSRFVNNVTVESANWAQPRHGKVKVEGNVEAGPVNTVGFYNYPQMDLRTDNKTILSKFPLLNQVFPKVGLQKDPYRTEIPSRESVGGLKNFGSTVEGEEDADLDR
ncbi:MAG: right-handed parallel beta-helix repeat-containing protein [Roseibacillus sp.]